MSSNLVLEYPWMGDYIAREERTRAKAVKAASDPHLALDALRRAHGYLSRASVAADIGKDDARGDGPLTYPYAVGAAVMAIEIAIATLACAEGRSDE